MCDMLAIVGKKLEETTKDKKRLDGYFVILEKWGKNKVKSFVNRCVLRSIISFESPLQ